MQVKDLVWVVDCRERLGSHYIEWMEHIDRRLFHDIDFSIIFLIVHWKLSDFEWSMGSEEKWKLFF